MASWMRQIKDAVTSNPVPRWPSEKDHSKANGHRRGEFSEEALDGLADLEARLPPPNIFTEPAFSPGYQRNSRLSRKAAAGGGLITDDQGGKRPHYWGHRERLRSRFLKGGQSSMPDYEVLELLLFNAIPRIDVKPLAKRLLQQFGDLSGVIGASEHRILQVDGADPKVFYQLRLAEAFAERLSVTKLKDRDVVSSWEALVTYCRTAMAHREREQFRVLFLDQKNYLLADEPQADGTVGHVPVYPREIVRRAIELSASAVILVHNHPSGDPTPSEADIDMTGQILAASETLGITVHDHIIVGKQGEYSFAACGLIG